VRQLKEKGVEVYFEKKNFDTAESAMFQVFRHCNETFGV
jgi:hypothetical protein